MLLAFEKWHGCLNDFLVVWLTDADGDVVLDSIKRQAKTLCDRRASVGGDGILVLKTRNHSDLSPYGLVIINSDGSIAKTCGNGLRCAASSVLKMHKEKGDPKSLPELVEFAVEGAQISCRFASTGNIPTVMVEMGVPTLNEAVPWCPSAKIELARVAKEIGQPDLLREFGVCLIGNPHLVIWTDHASRELMLKIGPALQKSAAWDGINVHIARPKQLNGKDQTRAGNELGQRISEIHEVFVWERGSGETMACGSGACAVAALALAAGLTERSEWLAVDMPGGRLYCKQQEESEPVLLAGPATFCYIGRVTL